MLILRLLFVFHIIPLCQTCLPKSYDQEVDVKSIRLIKTINDLEDLITDLNITNHFYDYYAQKPLKNRACHECPQFKSSNCTVFNKNLRCRKPKIWYQRDGYCLRAESACYRSVQAMQGRLINKTRLDDDYGHSSEDDRVHETYGLHQLHTLTKTVEHFPIRGSRRLIRKRLNCMTDKRWYHRVNDQDIIIRVDQIFCL
ncbi:unnamed protein product [Litomosoides sigmodontis]|uniref:Uncharacterized protein n=1 Tax=Litomosoides sigmodontis TaxID=42156 RepID=A0A3P6T221_LITSI|nr:unnamed protein product [Litomosoides sigmodontis]